MIDSGGSLDTVECSAFWYSDILLVRYFYLQRKYTCCRQRLVIKDNLRLISVDTVRKSLVVLSLRPIYNKLLFAV